jgi:hypothetical protein
MARLNLVLIPNFWLPRAQEGGPARTESAELQLRRSVPACTRSENEFHDDQKIAAGEDEPFHVVEPAAQT